MNKSNLSILFVLTVFVFFFSILYFHNNSISIDESQINYKPQEKIQFNIGDSNNTPPNILATTLPEFVLNLAEEKFKNLLQVNASEISSKLETSLTNAKGDEKVKVETNFNQKNNQISFTPKISNKLKPGLYKLDIKIKTVKGKDITITQDFTWGVLAINTNKGIYQIGEKVKFAMAVLDELGRTKCIANGKLTLGTANVWLNITSPSGKIQTFSTDDGEISGSKGCGDRKVTNEGDFLAQVEASEKGKYKVNMTAETIFGKKSIDYYFKVQENAPAYDIERTTYPTRIYPFALYPIIINIKANQDYSGTVYDILPNELKISGISSSGKVKAFDSFQTVNWQVNFKKGESYTFSYTIKFPRVAPEFYLIGPLTVGEFKEEIGWQVASDSIFSLIKEAHNTATSGTSLAVTFSSGATVNHLLILVCSRDSNNTINTPAGWTRAWRYTAAAPRISLFYRLATAGYTTGTCSFSTNSGSLAGQMMEFSGNSTSGYYDGSATANSSTACNTSPFTATTNNRTPSNPDVLMVSAFVSSAGSRTFSGHKTITGAGSNGFTQNFTNGFSDANMSADSAWGEAVNNPAVAQNDTATLSGAGTRCSMGLSSFNPSFTISQGSYRFFDNANSITPGGTLAPVNTTMQLGFPNYPFRIRFLLDVDSPSGTTLGLQTGDFILQYATMSAGMASCLNVSQWDPVMTAADGTDISFYTNPDSGGSGSNISTVTGDPTDASYTSLMESYYEDNINGPNGPNPGNITNDQNALGNNQAGLWDLSLVDNTDDSYSRHYCLRVINGDGTELDAYRNYPQVITVQTDVTIRGDTIIRGNPGSGTIIR